MIVYLLLCNFLYFSKYVSWASYANKAHRQVKNLWLLIWEKHNREGEIVKPNVKSSKYVTGIFPTNNSSTVQGSYVFFLSWEGVIIYLTSSMFSDCVDHNKLWKILQEMGIPDRLTCPLRNLYAGQEATVRTGHGTTDWFQIGKGVLQGSISWN